MTRAAIVAVLGAVGVACAHASAIPARAVRAGLQCGGPREDPSARWLAGEGALREALAAEGALGAAPLPAVDFAAEGVVLVALGRRPTAGYAIGLAGPRAAVSDGVATVAVRFEEPPPGAILAQVVTSPCLLVALPRAGLRAVRVVDERGAVRAVATVAP